MAARLPATRLPVAWRGPLPALIHGLGLGAPARAWLEGRSVDGGPYRLTQERGQVVLVVLWSTACALCIETLSDLHSRCAIWQARPFAVVTLATDAQHEHVVATARRLPPAPDVTVLWRGAPGHRDGFGSPEQLPTAFLVDRDGRIVERYVGRLPDEAWARIETLLA